MCRSPFSLKPNSFVCFILFCLLSACSGDDDREPVEDSGVGSLEGRVLLHDAFGIPVANDDMLVSIQDESFRANTAENGTYVFNRVPVGNYELIFEKEGFGTFRAQIEHARSFERGNTRLQTYFLGQESNTVVRGGTPTFGNNTLEIALATIPAGSATNPVYASAFFGKDETVSNEVNLGVIGPIMFNSGSANVELEISLEQLQDFGFVSGETVHFKVYGDSFHTNEYMTETGTVHPNVNNSAANFFVSGSIIIP